MRTLTVLIATALFGLLTAGCETDTSAPTCDEPSQIIFFEKTYGPPVDVKVFVDDEPAIFFSLHHNGLSSAPIPIELGENIRVEAEQQGWGELPSSIWVDLDEAYSTNRCDTFYVLEGETDGNEFEPSGGFSMKNIWVGTSHATFELIRAP